MAEPPKFYTDSHIAKAVVVQARQHGVDIIHCAEIGRENADDSDHLEYATGESRTMVSGDADFARLHQQYQASGNLHAGIIYVQPYNRNDIGTIVKFIIDLYELIKGDAGDVETDVYNQMFYL